MKFKIRFHTVLPAICFGAATGTLTAVAVNLYKVAADYAISHSRQGYAFLRQNLWMIIPVLVFFLLPAFLYAFIYQRIPNLRGGGIPTSIGILRGIIPFRWVRNFLGIFALSIGSFFIGVPLGKGGPSVQMGVALGRGTVFCAPKKRRAWERYSMTGGACAGFSVATGAPISGVIFAVEEAHQRICPMILTVAAVSVMFASVTNELLAPLFGVSKGLFPSMSLPTLKVQDVWIPLLVGLTVGLFAVAFLKYYHFIVEFFHKTLHKIPQGWRIFAIFALTMAAGIFSFSFISTGQDLIMQLLNGKVVIPMLILLLVVRATLTLCANTNRITGGIFLPLLAVGALVSALLGKSLEFAFGLDHRYYSVILVLGIVACIAGMMKMPLTAIVFAAEALSCYDNIAYVIVTAGMAFAITELFGEESINDRVLENRVSELNEGKKSTVLDRYLTVREGAYAVGMHVRDIFWPNGCFVLSHTHTVDVPAHAAKELHASDVLHVRCATYDSDQTKQELNAILGEQDFRLL